MNKYPFITCLCPRTIVNPYTNENMLVSCGKCESCLQKKSAISSLKCQLESLSASYTFFVTLTYNNEYIPRMIPICADDYTCDNNMPLRYYFVDNDNRDDIISDAIMSYNQLFQLQKKCNLGNYIPYLRKLDVQLFLKRLRKSLKKYTDEKIRYYLVGEYGPVHFRPHYHLLLWLEGEQAKPHIRHCIRSSWRFGRIDVQKPVGDCSSYVAGYLNGSCHLPQILRNRKSSPFNSHSFFLGEKFLQKSKEEVYETSASDFVKRRVPINGTLKDIFIWNSLKTTYYPKCSKFATSDFTSLIRTYRLYEEVTTMYVNLFSVSDVDKELTPMFLSRWILKSVIDDADYVNNNTFKYLMYHYKFDKYNILGESYFYFILRQIYMDLRISFHFLNFCCNSYSISEIKCKINRIIQFYKDLDYLSLCQQLKNEQEFLSDGYTIDELVYFDTKFYNDSDNVEKFKNSLIFKQFREATLKNYQISTKKKRLNDLNKIFYDF